MPKQNQQQNKDIATIKTDVSWLKERVGKIENQVFNEIPHQIDSIKDRIFYGFLIGIVAVIIAQIILKFF